MKMLITLLGPSNWGLFNSLWGTIRFHGFVPDKVLVLGRRQDREDFETVRAMMKPLLREYGSKADIAFEEIEGGSVDYAFEKVSGILRREASEDWEFALDVTPGRKAAVLGSILAGWGGNRQMRSFQFDHVFYLYIESLRNASRPFILIPFSQQRSHDIVSENKGGKSGA